MGDRIKIGIKKRMIRMFLAISMVVVGIGLLASALVMLYLKGQAMESTRDVGESVAGIGEELLLTQAVDTAQQFADAKAENITAKIQGYMMTADSLADEIAWLYERPEEFRQTRVLTPDEIIAEGYEGGNVLQWAPCDEKAETSQGVRDEVALLGNMESTFASMMKNYPELLTLYVTTESGISYGYDNTVEQKTGLRFIETRDRTWYVQAKERGVVYVSEAYEDTFGRGLTVTVASPVMAGGRFVGVFGMDMLIDQMSEEIFNTSFSPNGTSVLLTREGKLVSAQDISGERRSLEDFFGEKAGEIIRSVLSGSSGGIEEFTVKGKATYIVRKEIPLMEWELLILMPAEDIVGPIEGARAVTAQLIDASQKGMGETILSWSIALMLFTLLLLAAMIPIIRKASGRITRPIEKLTGDICRIGSGKFDYVSDIHTGDEIELLSDSFEQMSRSLKEYVDNLTAVTAEKERIGTELKVATQIQADMLPRIFPAFPDRKEFDVYAMMNPAKEVGGDFYDFFLVDSDHLAVVMADVSGKGVPAALFMVIAKTLIKNHVQGGEGPAEAFTQVNDQLCESDDAGLFVTAWMGLLEISTGHFTYVNAGHNPPLLCRSGGDYEWLKSKPGFVLSGMPGMKYTQADMILQRDDRLFLYTDGVTEAMNRQGQLYGEERLREELNQMKDKPLRDILPRIRESIDLYADGAEQFDDITMLVLQYTP